eukprot:gene57970-77359_t
MTPFEAVAEPNRRAILDLLRGGELPAGDLVEATGLSQPGVSKHLRMLREAGLVSVRPDGQRRLYRLEAGELAALDDWIKPFRAFWANKLDALELLSDAPLGVVTTHGDTQQVVFERQLRAPVEKVWAALTTPERLADWFGDAVVDLRVGGSIRLWKEVDVEITVCDPPNSLAWTWELDG